MVRMVTTAMPRRRSSSSPGGSGWTVASSVIPVRKRRSAPSSAPAASPTACSASSVDAVRRREPEREARAAQPLDVAAQEHGPAAADPHGLERGGAAEERLVVGVEDRLRPDRRGPCRATAAASSAVMPRTG